MSMRIIFIIGLNLFCQLSLFAMDTQTQKRQAITNLIKNLEKEENLSGSLFVQFSDNSTLEIGSNLANDIKKYKNNAQTIFLIASVTKTFTAVATLLLVDDKKFSLHDPISLFFPEYPKKNLAKNGKEVKIIHLLNHSSGLADAYEDEQIIKKLFKEEISFQELLNAIKNRPLISEPGKVKAYSNTGYLLLGEIIRRISQQTFHNFLKQRIFIPLGMKHSTVGPPIEDKTPSAIPYKRLSRSRISYIDYYHIKEMHVNDTFTDGNIYSNAQDLLRWAALSQSLLSEESRKALFQDYGEGFGLGWAVKCHKNLAQIICHDGEWIGYTSYLAFDIKNNTGFTYLWNQDMSLEKEAKLKDQLAEIIFN